MTTESVDEERGWAADKRDFVADRRDEIADERDTAADARDRIADAREAELDQWEQQLAAQAADLRASEDGNGGFTQPAEAQAGRLQAQHDRDQALTQRTAAATDRDDATKRRQADAAPTRLAMAFAGIAEQLYSADSFDEVLLRIAQAAVATVAGSEMASVTVVDASGHRTGAATDPAAIAVDQAQYEADEGPSLDSLDAPMVYAPSFPDDRWPTLAARPTEFGVKSALSYGLGAVGSGAADPGLGSLNFYGVAPDAFSDTAQEIGLILAAHASLAARVVHERSTLQNLGRNLQQALLSRDVIGQAKGILMERLKITPEDAFDLLRRSSQHLNVKLREVARTLAETGKLSDRRHLPPAGGLDSLPPPSA
jgi:ANTAR domain